ncbi:hypothetical protein D3C71_1207240 [compost metagenome]
MMASGKATGVFVVLRHASNPAQYGSPPLEAFATLTMYDTGAPTVTADGSGVTGMTNEWEVIRPGGTVQVTFCWTAVQPGGSVPMRRDDEMASVISAGAVVGLPLLLSFRV